MAGTRRGQAPSSSSRPGHAPRTSSWPGRAPHASTPPVGDGSGEGVGVVGEEGTAATTAGAAAAVTAAEAVVDVPATVAAAAAAVTATEAVADTPTAAAAAADAVDSALPTTGACSATAGDALSLPISSRSRLSPGRRVFPPVPLVRVPSMASQDHYAPSPRTGFSAPPTSARRSLPSGSSPSSGSVARQLRGAVRSARGAGGGGKALTSPSEARPPSMGGDRRVVPLFSSAGSSENIGDMLVTSGGGGGGGGGGDSGSDCGSSLSVGVGHSGRRGGGNGAWSPASGSLVSSSASLSPAALTGRVLRSATSSIPSSPTCRSTGGAEEEAGSSMTAGKGNDTSTGAVGGEAEAAAAPVDDGECAWSGAADLPVSMRCDQRLSPVPFVQSTRLSVVSPFQTSYDSHGGDGADAGPVTSPSLGSLRKRMRRLLLKPAHLLGVHEALHRHVSHDGELRGAAGGGQSVSAPNGREPPLAVGGAIAADGGDPLTPWPTTLIRRTASLLLPHSGAGGSGGHGPSAGVVDSPPATPGEAEVTVRRRLSVLSFTALWGVEDAASADEALDASAGACAEEAPPTRSRLYGHLHRAPKSSGARRARPHTPVADAGGVAARSQCRHSPAEEAPSRWDAGGGPEPQAGLPSRRGRPHSSTRRAVDAAPASPTAAARLLGRLTGAAGGGGGSGGGGSGGDWAGGNHGGRERPKRGDPVSYGARALSGGEPGVGRRPLPAKGARLRSASTPALAFEKRVVGQRRDLSADRRRRWPSSGGGGRDGSVSIGGSGGKGGGGAAAAWGGGSHADRPRALPSTALSAQCEHSSRKAAAFEFSVASSERMLNSLVSIENT